jgi:hypothetical protein
MSIEALEAAYKAAQERLVRAEARLLKARAKSAAAEAALRAAMEGAGIVALMPLTTAQVAEIDTALQLMVKHMEEMDRWGEVFGDGEHTTLS